MKTREQLLTTWTSLKERMLKLRQELAQEKGWWDKWIKSDKTEYNVPEIYEILTKNLSKATSLVPEKFTYFLKVERWEYQVLKEECDKFKIESCRRAIQSIYQYYRNGPSPLDEKKYEKFRT